MYLQLLQVFKTFWLPLVEMANVGISVAAKLAEYSPYPLLPERRHLFCVGKITRNLEMKKKDLIGRQERVHKEIEKALKRAEEIEDDVKRWEEKVKETIAKVENLEQELKANSGFFRGWCPTWKRYRLCKQLAEETEIMLQLDRDSIFDPFSHVKPLPDIEYFSSGNFMYFKSTKEAEAELMKALGDESCYMVGLYGMGGSGKTSLATEVGKKAKKDIFDRVVFTTVSQQPNIRKIQDEIADVLGQELKEKSEAGRAIRLSMRLKSGERILIVLDDVWRKLDFDKIGIPAKGDHGGCKVLLTTRLQQVCTSMDCNTRIPLDLLSEEESWSLFKKHAGIQDASSPISVNEVARGIVRECKGLPIAIVAVGSSLKGKSDDEWKVALDNLRHSKPLDVEPGVRDAFTCLKLSYDYLNKEAAKPIFLMCGMFPEDHWILIEDLFRYGIGLGLCGQVDSFEIARNKVNVAIRNLVESCLLTYSGERSEWLKMHDMVRDVALWIASKEKGTIVVDQGNKMNELAEDEAVKDYYAISSWNMEMLPRQLNAPKLEILLLNETRRSSENQLDLSHESFEGVKELKVMAIIGAFRGTLCVLPQSTQWLTNLRTLRLVNLKLDDISFVVSLRRLEILDLHDSRLNELPNGIEKLKKLKLLDLSVRSIKKDGDDVIGKCSKLEELYICGGINIKSYKCIEENANFMKLRSYRLSVGGLSVWAWLYAPADSRNRVLLLKDLDISTSGEVVMDLLRRAAEVGLEGLKGGCKSIIPKMVQTVKGMNELTKLCLKNCNEIECLINKTSTHDRHVQVDDVFPMLVELTLEGMSNLEEVYCGPLLLDIFQKLETLSLVECPKLTSIFSMSPLSIPQHEGDDPSKIVSNEEPQNISNSEVWFPNLKLLRVERCNKLKRLFSTTVIRMLPQLDYLQISRCEQLEEIFMHETDDSEEKIVLPKLRAIQLQKLPVLVDVCQGIKLHAVELTDIDIDECPILAPVSEYFKMGNDGQSVEKQLNANGDQQKVVSSTTKSLTLRNLSDLIFIWKGPTLISFRSLVRLKVGNFKTLKSIFSATVIRSLPQLERLYVRDCEELEEIISDEEEKEGQFLDPSNSHPQQVCFPKLRDLDIRKCHKLQYVFPVCMARDLPVLEYLEIIECSKLERVFGSVREGHDGEVIELVLPKLKWLILFGLPSLVDICAGFQSESQFQPLEICFVHGCPKLSSTTKLTLDKFAGKRRG